MLRHLQAIEIVSALRVLLEALLGSHLIVVAVRWGAETWSYHPEARPEPGDREVFLGAGIFLVVLAVIRLVQLLGSVAVRRRARRAGLFLAALDLVTPFTLPLAFWGLVVYRHPDVREHFERRTSAARSPQGSTAPG